MNTNGASCGQRENDILTNLAQKFFGGKYSTKICGGGDIRGNTPRMDILTPGWTYLHPRCSPMVVGEEGVS